MKIKTIIILIVLISINLSSQVYAHKSLPEFVHSSAFSNKSNNEIEIFDVKNEKVIKRIPNNKKIINEASNVLENLEFYGRIHLNIKEGYMIKIPINKIIINKWVNCKIREVIVILEPNQIPIVLLMNQNDKPYLFTTKYHLKYITELTKLVKG